MNNKRDMERKINAFIKKAKEDGLFDKEYASEEERNREIRKLASKNFNVHAEFIGIEQEQKGNLVLTKMRVEQPVYIK